MPVVAPLVPPAPPAVPALVLADVVEPVVAVPSAPLVTVLPSEPLVMVLPSEPLVMVLPSVPVVVGPPALVDPPEASPVAGLLSLQAPSRMGANANTSRFMRMSVVPWRRRALGSSGVVIERRVCTREFVLPDARGCGKGSQITIS
jgi:hypothetical protein